MHRAAGAFAFLILLGVGLASPSSAALLTLSGSTLTFQLGGGGSLVAHQPLTFPQNTASVLVSATSSGGFVEPAGIFTGTQMLPTSLFTALPVMTIAGLMNLTKTIAPGALGSGQATGIVRPGGGLGGPGPLQGDLIINILSLFNLVVPLENVGSTGASSMVTVGALKVAVLGTGWTTGGVSVTGITTETAFGFATNTITFDALGFDNRTPAHNGVIQLVSAFKVITNAAGNVPGYALQRLTFSGGVVPEPGMLVLLGSGVAALVLRGWRLRRRRQRP
jgi:hypothetical protein